VLGFQFNIDFHPTRRKFLDAPNELRSSRGNETPSNPAEVSLVTSTATGHRETANTGPWVYVHTPGRNWHTDTDRAMLPLRSLVPIERDGLLGASKNIGVSSLVSAAVRVHAHTTLIGQAAGTAAWLCLRDGIQPRELARDWSRIRELQLRLVRGVNGAPGVLLWPYHDLAPDDVSFEAVNMLSVQRILEADADSLDFQPFKMVTLGELRDTLQRAARSRGRESAPFDSEVDQRRLTSAATWKDLAAGLRQLGLKPRTNLEKDGQQPLNLQELARILWAHVKGLPERIPQAGL